MNASAQMSLSRARIAAPFFLRADVVRISRELLGRVLCTRVDGERLTAGIIVETEAYAGPEDRASHAYGGRMTARTRVMFSRGPAAYVYLCYGMHWLFNIVTNIEGIPHAVLVRAVQPVIGLDLMLKRSGQSRLDWRLTAGPGRLARALGISGKHSGCSLLGNSIWVEQGMEIASGRICSSRRVGVSYAGRDARLPWRFFIRGNPWVSRA